MYRIHSLILPLLLASIAVAEEPTNDQLVERLADDEYRVREDATKALIARGASAIPALEKAVKSEDVEVRMRAGRALRSIRDRQLKEKRQPKRESRPPPPPPTSPSTGREPVEPRADAPVKKPVRSQSVSMAFRNNEYVVTITKGTGKERVTKTYKGKSLDEIKKKHPEVRAALSGARLQFGPGAAARDPFKDFDKFFNDDWFNKRRDRNFLDRDFWKKADGDLNAEIARLRQWAKWLAAQEQRRRGQRAQRGLLDRNAQNDGLKFGMRARRPESVLDAQLELRGRGLVIEEVLRDSPAAKLGLKRFDIILELNGVAIRRAEDIGPSLRRVEANSPLRAKVLRRARPVELPAPAAKAK